MKIRNYFSDLRKYKLVEKKKKICRDQGSNQGPSDLQSDALPTELSRHVEIYEKECKSETA